MRKQVLTGGVLIALLATPAAAQTTWQGSYQITQDLEVGRNLTVDNTLTVNSWSYFNQRTVYSGSNANWTVENVGGTLSFYAGYYTNPNVRFLSSGDVSLPGRVSIGSVACNPACAGNLGTNNMMLAVGGQIGAQGGVYVMNYGAAWPDYVFQRGYRLRPLAEVAQYIRTFHHLPEVPSAAQVQTNGLELAAMNATLLKKVEEMTLYLLQLQAANQALAERVAKLETSK